MEIEYQVRRGSFGPQGKAHGGSASHVCKVAYKPTLSITSATLSPSGLAIALSLGTFTRSGNTYSLTIVGEDGNYIVKSYAVGGKASSTTIVIPLESLLNIPSASEAISVSCVATTCDGIRVSKTQSVSVSLGSGCSATFTPMITETKCKLARINAGTSGRARAWLAYDGKTKELNGSGGIFTTPHPFGRVYKLIVIMQMPNNTWGIWSRLCDATHDRFYMWNWGSGCFKLEYGIEDVPKLNYSSDHDYEANITSGSDYEVVQIGSARKQGWTVKGALIADEDEIESKLAEFEECTSADFRDPFGHVIRVSVISMSVEYIHHGHASVSVTMRRTG